MRDSVLVVGGAGYIGSHTAKLLHKQGYEPVTLDDLSTGHHEAVQFGPLYDGGYDDIELLEKVIKRHDISVVMHFGAKALVQESVENPHLYYEANVAGTLGLIKAMLNCGVKNFVFSSTCATFGIPPRVPMSEDLPQHPINPYGQSKLMVEQILRDMRSAYGLNSVILRYFNAAGADPEGQLGEDHEPETHLIPRALRVALGRDPTLVVFGNDYPTADGSCVRDYVHINDLGDAHIRGMELMRKTGESYEFNLGSEKGYSVLEVIAAVEKVAGVKLNYEFGPRRPGDPPALVADSSKARKVLGWRCQHDLESMVATAYQFMKRHPKGYQIVEH